MEKLIKLLHWILLVILLGVAVVYTILYYKMAWFENQRHWDVFGELWPFLVIILPLAIYFQWRGLEYLFK